MQGRAGMVSISDPDSSLDLNALAACFIKFLPPYARPLFIRILDIMDMTGWQDCFAIQYVIQLPSF